MLIDNAVDLVDDVAQQRHEDVEGFRDNSVCGAINPTGCEIEDVGDAFEYISEHGNHRITALDVVGTVHDCTQDFVDPVADGVEDVIDLLQDSQVKVGKVQVQVEIDEVSTADTVGVAHGIETIQVDSVGIRLDRRRRATTVGLAGIDGAPQGAGHNRTFHCRHLRDSLGQFECRGSIAKPILHGLHFVGVVAKCVDNFSDLVERFTDVLDHGSHLRNGIEIGLELRDDAVNNSHGLGDGLSSSGQFGPESVICFGLAGDGCERADGVRARLGIGHIGVEAALHLSRLVESAGRLKEALVLWLCAQIPGGGCS